MKKEQFMFHGTLLVPVENLPTNLKFVWIGTVRSESDEIDVIAFRTADKENFRRMLEEDLEQLEHLQEAPNVAQQKAFIKKTLCEMKRETSFRKEPQLLMLEAATRMVAEALAARGTSLQRRFTPNDVIYTSWVVGVL